MARKTAKKTRKVAVKSRSEKSRRTGSKGGGGSRAAAVGTKAATKKRTARSNAARAIDAGRRPRAVGTNEVTIRSISDGAVLATIPLCDNKIESAAMAWSYRVRNRARWNATSRGQDAQAHQCREVLAQIGVSSEQLDRIADKEIIELAIPFQHETEDWAPRIMPWEYLLSAATKSARKDRSLTVFRHLDRRNGRRSASTNGGLALIVSEPGQIAEAYDFSDELRMVPARLMPKRKMDMHNPTLAGLAATMKRAAPEIVHVAGVDTHEGGELLPAGRSGSTVDGMMLADDRGGATPVEAWDLAKAITSGRRAPRLVVYNIHQSAARTAALTVAEGAEIAIGFQDVFDDLAAEIFFGGFYHAWAATNGDLLVAVQGGWEALHDFPKPLAGTGIAVWTGTSLCGDRSVAPTARAHRIVRATQSIASVGKNRALGETLSVKCEPNKAFNYSLLHNRRSLFREFVVRKDPRISGLIPDVQVEVQLSAGGEPVVYRSKEVIGDVPVDLRQKVFLPLTSELTRSLQESLDTSLHVKVTQGRESDVYTVHQESHRVTLLPINEWVDDDENRQFLPSFIWPLDPAIRRIVGTAQRHLHTLADDSSAGFDGYQSVDWESDDIGDPTAGVDQQVAALWRGLLDQKLGYVNPPPTYSDASQRLRTPTRMLEEGRGTCIDLTLILAACLEYVDIYPVIFLLKGHAFPGYWRSEEEWTEFMDVSSLDRARGAGERVGGRAKDAPAECEWVFPKSYYKLIIDEVEAGRLVPLESVWLTSRSGFSEAMDEGWDNLSSKREFDSLIDVKKARLAQPAVTPLPLGTALQ